MCEAPRLIQQAKENRSLPALGKENNGVCLQSVELIQTAFLKQQGKKGLQAREKGAFPNVHIMSSLERGEMPSLQGAQGQKTWHTWKRGPGKQGSWLGHISYCFLPALCLLSTKPGPACPACRGTRGAGRHCVCSGMCQADLALPSPTEFCEEVTES